MNYQSQDYCQGQVKVTVNFLSYGCLCLNIVDIRLPSVINYDVMWISMSFLMLSDLCVIKLVMLMTTYDITHTRNKEALTSSSSRTTSILPYNAASCKHVPFNVLLFISTPACNSNLQIQKIVHKTVVITCKWRNNTKLYRS